jgi:hypothetical protein
VTSQPGHPTVRENYFMHQLLLLLLLLPLQYNGTFVAR